MTTRIPQATKAMIDVADINVEIFVQNVFTAAKLDLVNKGAKENELDVLQGIIQDVGAFQLLKKRGNDDVRRSKVIATVDNILIPGALENIIEKRLPYTVSEPPVETE